MLGDGCSLVFFVASGSRCSAFAVVSFFPFRWLVLVLGCTNRPKGKVEQKKKGGVGRPTPVCAKKWGGYETTAIQPASLWFLGFLVILGTLGSWAPRVPMVPMGPRFP